MKTCGISVYQSSYLYALYAGLLAAPVSCCKAFSTRVSGLRADLMEKNKILMDFSTLAINQVKVINHLRSSGTGDRSITITDNTTLPWTGSVTTGTPAPALVESCWHHQGAKPKT